MTRSLPHPKNEHQQSLNNPMLSTLDDHTAPLSSPSKANAVVWVIAEKGNSKLFAHTKNDHQWSINDPKSNAFENQMAPLSRLSNDDIVVGIIAEMAKSKLIAPS
jgi:hypothetical protein